MSDRELIRQKKIRRRRRKLAGKIIIFILLLVLMAALLVLVFKKPEEDRDNENKAQSEQPAQQEADDDPVISDTPVPAPSVEPLPVVSFEGLNSTTALLTRVSDGAVVLEMEGDKKIYPASMTKIMTAVVALENLKSLDETIVIDRETYDRLYLDGASLAGFQPGDEVKAIDMIYGIMLPSGAECCVGMSIHLFGSEEGMVEKMNEKAQELGMTHTHFVTSTGLHDPEHYTTAEDMTLLLEYALKNETFRTVFTTESYTTSPTVSVPEGLSFSSTMFKNLVSSEVTGGSILGGKTGYTQEAGQCLASLASVDGTEYILVTAGAPGSPSTEPMHVQDAVRVYEQIHSY